MADFELQSGDEIERISESKLRGKLRSNDLSGLQLVRRVDESQWVPLYATPLFADEVAFQGSPFDAARFRHVRGFTSHALAFITTYILMTFAFGAGGSWLLIWGAFVAGHGLKVLPTAVSLARERKLLDGATAPHALAEAADNPDRAAALPEPTPEADGVAPPGPAASWQSEIDEIEALLAGASLPDPERLHADLQSVAGSLSASVRRQAELAEQIERQDAPKVRAQLSALEARLSAEGGDANASLLRAEADSLANRVDAIRSAEQVLARLSSQQRVVENRLQQLRLELSTARATDADVAEIAHRLEHIQIDIDAAHEVDRLTESDDTGRPGGP